MSRIDQALRRFGKAPRGIDTAEHWRAPFGSTRAVVGIDDYTTESPAKPAPQSGRGSVPVFPDLLTAAPTLASTGESVEYRLLSDRAADPRWMEPYRRLAATLHHLKAERSIKVLMVTSAVPREGKTLTSANLALALSGISRRVLLIDGDLRRPCVHDAFGISNSTGLAEGLASEQTTLPVIDVSPNLSVLPAGRSASNAAAGIVSERMSAVLKEASERFDWVILDSSPANIVSEPYLMSGLVDGVILVIGAGETNYQLIERTIAEIGRERIIGAVLNRVEADGSSDNYQHYYYYDRPEPGVTQP